MHQTGLRMVRMRVFSRLPVGLAASLALVLALNATTLEQLTLEDMIRQSTSIVRARVGESHSAYKGPAIYTYFPLQVLETWKTTGRLDGRTAAEVAVPGGVVDGIRQNVTGAAELQAGQEYILFLWTSRSGLTQVIGLSQGRFRVFGDMVQRPPASELMLDRSGRPVENQAMSLRLEDLRAQVLQTLSKAPGSGK